MKKQGPSTHSSVDLSRLSKPDDLGPDLKLGFRAQWGSPGGGSPVDHVPGVFFYR